MAAKSYTSALDRLLDLPEIFTGRNLTVKFQWPAATASTYLANWRKAGLVRSLGGHSDVHMNLAKNRQPNAEAALRRALPEAVKTGADILREAGWTTQIPSRPEVAVASSSPRYKLPGFELTARPQKWFALVLPGTEDLEPALRRLQPAWALADMIAQAMDRRKRNTWLLAPDDLDLEAVRADPAVIVAAKALRLPEAVLQSDAGYASFYDGFNPPASRCARNH